MTIAAKIAGTFAAMPLLLALAACGTAENAGDAGSAADDFAARIKSGNPEATPETAPVPQGTVAPTVAEPLPNAAEGAFAPGTATDPASATCGANEMGQFIGLEASDDVQLAIINVIDGANEVRFVAPGGEYVRPDATNPRLNIMLDSTNIIRDARCG